MERAKRHDPEDLETIYREHHRRVRWVLRARGVRGDALEDLTQETFLAIHRRLGGRDPELPLATFISGIARNVAFSHRRSVGRRLRASRELPAPEPARGPDDVVQERQAWRELELFLDDLKPAQREVFVLTEILGMRMPEIGSLIDAPSNTLYSRLKLARRRFQQRFGDGGEQRMRRGARGERPSSQQRRQTWVLIAGQLRGPGAPIDATAPSLSTAGTAVLMVATVAVAAGIAWSTSAGSGAESSTSRAGQGGRTHHSEPLAPDPRDGADETSSAVVTATSTSAPELPPSSASARARRTRTRPSMPASDGGAVGRAAPVDDAIAATVEALRRAQAHLREGRPRAALEVLDAPELRQAGSLERERHRLVREAACAAGQQSRAQQAVEALERLGAEASGAVACPKKTPSP